MVPLKALYVVYTWMDTYATYITKRDARYGRHNHIQLYIVAIHFWCKDDRSAPRAGHHAMHARPGDI